jgi:hypothetical protein
MNSARNISKKSPLHAVFVSYEHRLHYADQISFLKNSRLVEKGVEE